MDFLEPVTCKSSEFRCNDAQCIDSRWRCDEDFDCSDQSDEMNCPSNYSFNCTDNEWKCTTGRQCVHMSWMCDCEADCVDRSDELNCNYCLDILV